MFIFISVGLRFFFSFCLEYDIVQIRKDSKIEVSFLWFSLISCMCICQISLGSIYT